MTKIKLSAIALSVIVISFYLLLSFGMWSWNPYFWGTDARTIITLLLGLVILFLSVMLLGFIWIEDE